MSHLFLQCSTIPVPLGFGRIDDPPHLRLLCLRQFNVSRGPILLQPLRLSRARDGDHALRSHPSESDLRQGATFLRSEGLDLVDDAFVLVEVLALELRRCPAEIIRCEIVGRVEREVVHEPTVTEGTVSNIGHAELFGGVD